MQNTFSTEDWLKFGQQIDFKLLEELYRRRQLERDIPNNPVQQDRDVIIVRNEPVQQEAPKKQEVAIPKNETKQERRKRIEAQVESEKPKGYREDHPGLFRNSVQERLKEEAKLRARAKKPIKGDGRKIFWERYRAYKKLHPELTRVQITEVIKNNEDIAVVLVAKPHKTAKRINEWKIDMTPLNDIVLPGQNNPTHNNAKDYQLHLQYVRKYIRELITKQELPVKFVLNYRALLEEATNKEQQKFADFPTNREQVVEIHNSSDIDKVLDDRLGAIIQAVEEYLSNGSGWIIKGSIAVFMKFAVLRRLGKSYIPFPKWMSNKKFAINIKNKDDKCFLWSYLALEHPKEKNQERVSKYTQYESEVNMEGIPYPVSDKHYSKFEKQNKPINVFQFYNKDDNWAPIYISKIDNKKAYNIGLYENHYFPIVNFSRLIGKQHNNKALFCMNCMQNYRDPNHETYCMKSGPERIKMPTTEKDKIVRFRSIMKQLKKPVVIYSDFECIINNDKHEACGYCLYVVSQYKQLDLGMKQYRGISEDDTMEHYFNDLYTLKKQIMKVIDTIIPMTFTKENQIEFKNATNCHICKKPLKEDRVRDHDHLTGLFRGAAHEDCNINYKIEPKKFKIPIFYHNLKGYDSHIIINAFRKYCKTSRIEVIPQSSEKFLTFNIGNMQFVDTLAFMSQSLDSLVSTLSENDFIHLTKHFKEQTELVKRKGVYPYEYMNSFKRFEETNLPPIESFYSKLTEKSIKKEDYEYAEKVWNKLNIKNLGDYHDLYLKTDVLLLADVFEKFRDICLEQYNLDPAHFLTTPSLGWDSWQKMTGESVENLTNNDMYTLFRENIRGGICTTGSKRYTTANNKYLPDYDKSKPSTFNIYVDANNLYGYGMISSLPKGDYKFVKNTEKFTEEFILNYDFDNEEKGYYFIVNLECPKELHDKFNDYPLAPESLKPEASPFMKEQSEKLKHKIIQTKKLCLTLNDKTNYGVFGKLLQLYLDLGMKIKEMKQVISFKQSKWLKPYIDFNTNQRAKAKKQGKKFEVNFYKLMNNAVYGKFIENLTGRNGYELRTDNDEKVQKIINNPRLTNFSIIAERDENFPGLIGFEKKKRIETVINRPIAVGAAILDYSKYLMYDFYYNVMKKKYNDKVKLLYTDTDSLIMNIETEDIYQDMKTMREHFDFSEYPDKHIIFENMSNDCIKEMKNENCAVIGKFKDEVKGAYIKELIALKPKMYSLLIDKEGKEEHKSRAKGVPKQTKDKIKHEQYKDTLLNNSITKAKFNTIKSDKHIIKTIELEKITLTSLDDKRYYINANESRAHGHYLNNQK